MLNKTLQTLLQRIQTRDKLTVPWELQWLPIVLVAIEIVVFFASLLVVTTLMDASIDSPEPEVMVWVSLLSTLLLFVMTIQYVGANVTHARSDKKVKGDVTVWDWLYLNPSTLTPLWGVVLLAFALAVVVDVIGLALGVSETSLPLPLDGLNVSVQPFPFVVAAFVVVIFLPIVEEIIYRGVFQPALAKQMNPLYAIVITSVVYAGVHYLLDPQYIWWGLVVPLIVGLMAGTARAATKSTQTAIGVHAMFGLFVVLRALVS